jgi:hypothetical protein
MGKRGIVVALAPLVVLAGVADAQRSDVQDLVGTRAAGGENALRSRGYNLVRTQPSDDRVYTYWWNARSRQCITVATMDGRYDSITPTTAPDCEQRASSGGDRDDYRRPDRDNRRPDIGYQGGYGGGTYPRRESPSYAGGNTGYVDVNGARVDLGLVCFGDGHRPGFATTYGWSWNSRRDRYDFGNRTELTAQQFDASVMIQMWAGGGRIRLPRKLVPPINTRGSDGWWDLYDVSLGQDVIRAKYRLNGLNKPLITINRRSGQISINGTAPYAFRGTCDLIDGEDHRRF